MVNVRMNAIGWYPNSKQRGPGGNTRVHTSRPIQDEVLTIAPEKHQGIMYRASYFVGGDKARGRR